MLFRPLKVVPIIYIIYIIFIFTLKIHFSIKIKIKGTTSNDFDLDKCYPGHNLKQYLRGLSHRSEILGNTNTQYCNFQAL